jgi:hypothetical protein
MKLKNFFNRAAAFTMAATLGVTFSCQDSESLNLDTVNVVDESVSDYYYEDIDDMSNLSVAGADEAETGSAPAGRVQGPRQFLVDDNRLECATITVELDEASTQENPQGTITIDFGTEGTCKDNRNNVRKGKVIIAFDGRRFQPGSTVVTTLENYSINDIEIEGTRTLTNIGTSTSDAPTFQIALTDGVINWLDGTTTEREHYFVRKWVRAENPINDELQISFDANSGKSYTAKGTNRFGRTYEMTITKTLVYKRCSPIAVEGTKEFVTNDKVITIDYGDKTCDRKITLTIDGDSRVVGA